jgi:hypothetical protein
MRCHSRLQALEAHEPLVAQLGHEAVVGPAGIRHGVAAVEDERVVPLVDEYPAAGRAFSQLRALVSRLDHRDPGWRRRVT